MRMRRSGSGSDDVSRCREMVASSIDSGDSDPEATCSAMLLLTTDVSTSDDYPKSMERGGLV